MRLAVVDYGAGNLASVFRACHAAAPAATVTRAVLPGDIGDADALVLPGVGHFQATAALDPSWRDAITTRVRAGTPLLGICLGMQWLFEGSDEAPDLPGLGLFPGRCFALPAGRDLKIPHVGWNQLERAPRPSHLLAAVPDRSFAYFTHSYAAPVGEDAVALTRHGAAFASAVERERLFGTQWHPEKSGDVGLTVLRAFIACAERCG